MLYFLAENISVPATVLDFPSWREFKREVARGYTHVGMDTDLHQFMQLTPLPGTPLYERYQSEGKLIPQFPYTRLSGQNALAFHRPHFRAEEARELTRRAFKRKYKAGGPGIVK